MKYYFIKTYIAVILLLISACSYGQQSMSDNEFALYLKDLIVSGDINKFKEIPCYPSNCLYSDDIAEDDRLEYVFGTENNSSQIKSIMSLSNLDIKIYGPYEFSEGAIGQSYTFVYFDPAQVTFNEDGVMSDDVQTNLWSKGYVATVVTLSDGEWGLQSSPFFYGTHLPWMP